MCDSSEKETAARSALRAILRKLVVSDPTNFESWEVDFKPCKLIAKRHFVNWSVDASARADRRARGKSDVFTSVKRNQQYFNDTELETFIVRYTTSMWEAESLSKSGHTISNTCAELFLNRTSVPFYQGQKDAYPNQLPNEKEIASNCKDVWVYLRPSSGSTTSWGITDMRNRQRYNASKPRENLLLESGLVDNPGAAKEIMKKAYPRVFFANPRAHPDLGSELHRLADPLDKIHICAVACRGVFTGFETWHRFNDVLVQGGWPWLRGYSRAYARVIYTALVLTFAAIECYHLDDLDLVRQQLLTLAGKLVGKPNGGSNQWRVRRGAYLTGEHAMVPDMQAQLRQTLEGKVKDVTTIQAIPVSASTLSLPLQPNQNVNKLAALSTVSLPPEAVIDSNGHRGIPTIAWVHGSNPYVSVSGPMPSHVVTGAACGHSKAPPLVKARVKLATSVPELEQATEQDDKLTVALTSGDKDAQNEVLSFVLRSNIMTVQKGEEQCTGCAIRLGHSIGALVVIT